MDQEYLKDYRKIPDMGPPQPYYGPPPAGPSRAWYGLAIIIFLTGLSLFIMFLLKGILGMTGDMIQVVVPGSRVMELNEPGDYTIFHEYRSVVDGKVYASGAQLANMEIRVIDRASGADLPLSPVMGSSNYSMGGRQGYGVFNFQVSSPGEYEIIAEYTRGHTGPQTVLAISGGFVEELVITILGSIGILFGTITVTVLIVVITAIKRSKARSQASMTGGYEKIG
jgi:hypothetical protein